MNKDLYTAIINRRSVYGIGKEAVVPNDRVMEIVKQAVKFAPSAFNSQSGRVVVLFGDQHDRLWDITKETLRRIVPVENFPDTEGRINGFRNGYGTVLFFEDQSVIRELQEEYALYKDNFPIWSLQSSGMLQYIVWTSLEAEGLGANLQHYNPLIDEEVKKTWSLPGDWKLLAQMPFGKPLAPAGDKEFVPLEERVKVF